LGKIFDKILNWRLTVPHEKEYGRSQTSASVNDYLTRISVNLVGVS